MQEAFIKGIQAFGFPGLKLASPGELKGHDNEGKHMTANPQTSHPSPIFFWPI